MPFGLAQFDNSTWSQRVKNKTHQCSTTNLMQNIYNLQDVRNINVQGIITSNIKQLNNFQTIAFTNNIIITFISTKFKFNRSSTQPSITFNFIVRKSQPSNDLHGREQSNQHPNTKSLLKNYINMKWSKPPN
jgi:hypothetical protein